MQNISIKNYFSLIKFLGAGRGLIYFIGSLVCAFIVFVALGIIIDNFRIPNILGTVLYFLEYLILLIYLGFCFMLFPLYLNYKLFQKYRNYTQTELLMVDMQKELKDIKNQDEGIISALLRLAIFTISNSISFVICPFKIKSIFNYSNYEINQN